MEQKPASRKPASVMRYCDDEEFNAIIQQYLKELVLPEPRTPTSEELARRERLLEKTLRIRAELGPIPFTVAESVREDRERGSE